MNFNQIIRNLYRNIHGEEKKIWMVVFCFGLRKDYCRAFEPKWNILGKLKFGHCKLNWKKRNEIKWIDWFRNLRKTKTKKHTQKRKMGRQEDASNWFVITCV